MVVELMVGFRKREDDSAYILSLHNTYLWHNECDARGGEGKLHAYGLRVLCRARTSEHI